MCGQQELRNDVIADSSYQRDAIIECNDPKPAGALGFWTKTEVAGGGAFAEIARHMARESGAGAVAENINCAPASESLLDQFSRIGYASKVNQAQGGSYVFQVLGQQGI